MGREMEFEYKTKRIRLVAAHPSLASLTADFYSENKTFLAPFEPKRDPDFYTKKVQKQELKDTYQRMSNGQSVQYWLFPLKQTKIIGAVMLNQIFYGNLQSAFVAYKLAQNQTGNGYAKEAVEKLIELAFTDLNLHRIEANIMPHNTPSIRLVQSLGFQREGMRASYLEIDGKWQDHCCYSLLNKRQDA